MRTTKERSGKHVAIGAVAATLLLLSFVLWMRSDRPIDQPLEETWTAEALPNNEGAVDPALAPAGVETGAKGLPVPADRLLPSDRDPKAGNTPRLRKGPRIPKRDLNRPRLSLGRKPGEAPALRGATLAEVTGTSIDEEEIRRVVGENERDVKTCWEEEAKSQERSKKIEVALSVKPSGEVAKAQVRNVVRSEASDCIATKAKGWKFNAPGGRERQEVVIPFVVVRAT